MICDMERNGHAWVVKTMSDSGPVKPLPIVKGIDDRATELLSTAIDIFMKDLRFKSSSVMQQDVAKMTQLTKPIVSNVR